jgi:hypothetical protein
VSTLTECRDALAATIDAGVPGLRTASTVPPSVSPPVAVVTPNPAQLVDYGIVMSNGGLVVYQLRVYIIVGSVSDRTAQAKLDGYISPSGEASVPAAIAADPTLGGAVEWAVCTSAQKYGELVYSGVSLLGCEILVEVSTT